MSERLRAAKAVLTGKLPEKIVTRETVKIVTIRRERTGRREDKGSVSTGMQWSDKQPHPAVMDKLNTLNKDPEIETAITVMSEMVCSGYFTEMGEDVPKITGENGKTVDHLHKKTIDDWGEKVNADEKIGLAVRVMFEKGFSATEILDDYDLRVLPSETFFIWRHKNGEVYKYTQEVSGSVVATWQGTDLNKIVILVHKETPENPYGKAMAETLEPYITSRKEMTEDGAAVLKRLGYPLRRWETQDKALMDKVVNQVTQKAPNEDLFFDGLGKDDLRVTTEEVDARANFESFIKSTNELIAEGLFSPLMNYLRNATEASATKMLEAIDRHVQGIQRYVKRRVEDKLFKKIVVTAPFPRLVWGSPKTGLEKMTITDVANLIPKAITFEQGQDLLKKLGLPLMDIPEKPEVPELPQIGELPLLDKPRLQTVQTSLDVVEENFRAKNLDVATAFREATKIIDVHVNAARSEALKKMSEALGKSVKALSPESEQCFTLIRNELVSKFRERIIPHGAHACEPRDGQRYTVIRH